MFIVTKTKRKRRAKAASGSIPPPAAPETLDAEGRQVPPPDARARAPEDDSSVQDPLEDWPDDDQDRWLRERTGGDIEKSGE
jgi:hypothetical protein